MPRPRTVLGLAAAVLIATVVALPRLESEIAVMHGWPWLPLLSVSGLVLITVLGATGAIRTALAAALLVVVIDVSALSAGTVETVPITSSDELRRWIGPPVEGRGLTLCENQIGAGEFLVNHQPNVDGMAAIHLGPYGEWAYLAKFGQSPPGDGMFRRIGSEGAIPLRRDLIDLAHVTAIVSCQPLDEQGWTAVKVNSPFVYRNEQAWPRALWSCRAEPVSRAMAIARLLRSRFDGHGRLWPRHYMNVRWAPHVTADQRRTLERSHHLSEGGLQQGTTWRYSLDDQTVENVMAIMLDPAVEDTHGVDRKTGEPIRNPEPGTRNASEGDADGADEELLVHTGGCTSRGEAVVVAADRPDGSVAVDVKAESDGFLFLSEPFYSERQAFVDGRSVTSRRANIAFTAIPLPAGSHRVELRLVPRSFHVGLGMTALTLTGWLATVGRRLVRRSSSGDGSEGG